VKTFQALTTNVSVSIDDRLPLADVAHALVQNYPATNTADLHYVLEPGGVRRGDSFLPVEQPIDVTPAFEMDLYEQVVTRAERGWILHAAAVEVAGRALVLCGASGAGKTTLALALVARGFRLLTEEVAWIGADCSVRGLPRPLHVPEGSPQRARIPAGWLQLQYPIRDRDGRSRSNLLVVPPPEVMVFKPLPLATIVRIGHGADWETVLRESNGPEALQRLWDRALRRDQSGLEVATSVLRKNSSYLLSSRSEEEALGLLAPLLHFS
jgi:hypothetical protein